MQTLDGQLLLDLPTEPEPAPVIGGPLPRSVKYAAQAAPATP